MLTLKIVFPTLALSLDRAEPHLRFDTLDTLHGDVLVDPRSVRVFELSGRVSYRGDLKNLLLLLLLNKVGPSTV